MVSIRGLLIAAVVLTAASVTAGPAATRRAQVAVDLVTLKSGRSLRGAVVRTNSDGSIIMAVSRGWLQKANPELLVRREVAEAETRKSALEQLRDRIKRAAVGVADDSPLGVFLRSEAKRVERLLADPEPVEKPQFVWLDLTKKEIARTRPTTAENRRIAGWSWSEDLANVESRDVNDLIRELRRKGVDPSRPLPDLSDRFPIRAQDELEWNARLALIIYALHKPLDFQGTGGQLIAVERSGNAKDSGPIVAKLLGGEVEGMLKDLLGEGRSSTRKSAADDSWLKSACEAAESQNLRAFRATRVDLNQGGQQASVNSVFAIRLVTKKWQIVWSARESRDGTAPRPDVEATITEDPQVKSALAGVKSLGTAADDQIRRAIRFGAATMDAQKAVDRQFFAFEEPLLRHLDGPPFWW
jgi:hypothetical protein